MGKRGVSLALAITTPLVAGAVAAGQASAAVVSTTGLCCGSSSYDLIYRGKAAGERNNVTITWETEGGLIWNGSQQLGIDQTVIVDIGATIRSLSGLCVASGHVAECGAKPTGSYPPVAVGTFEYRTYVLTGDLADSIRTLTQVPLPLGPGAIIDVGAGPDTVDTVNGLADGVVCGIGRDTVRADRKDEVSSSCESVTRV